MSEYLYCAFCDNYAFVLMEPGTIPACQECYTRIRNRHEKLTPITNRQPPPESVSEADTKSSSTQKT
jgi:hypothetical protein